MIKAHEYFIAVDYLKCCLIGFVVLGHAIQWWCDDVQFLNHWLWTRIYIWHMAAFFFVSGFLSYRDNRVFKKDVFRIIELVWPYLIWGVIGMFIKTGGRLWYLSSLSFFLMCVMITSRIAKKMGIGEWIGCAMSISLFFTLDILGCRLLSGIRLHYFPFFLFGYLIRQRWGMMQRFLLNEVVIAIALSIGFFGVIMTGGMGRGDIVYTRMAERFLISCCVIIGLFGVFMRYLNRQLQYGSFFSYVGKITLGIYASHYLFLNLVTSMYSIHYAITFPAVFLLSVGFVSVILKIDILAMLLFGRVSVLEHYINFILRRIR